MRKAGRRVHTFKKSLFKYWLFAQYLMHKELRHIYEKAGTQKQKLSFKNGLTPLCLSAIYVYLLLSSMMVCAIRDDFYLLYRLVVAFLFIAPPLLHIGFAPKSHHFFWKKRGYFFILPRILYIPQQFQQIRVSLNKMNITVWPQPILIKSVWLVTNTTAASRRLRISIN